MLTTTPSPPVFSCFLQRLEQDLYRVAVRRGGVPLEGKIGDMILERGDTLLLDTNEKFFSDGRKWMLEKIHQCSQSRENIVLMDVTFEVGSAENDNAETISSNVSFLPLQSEDPDGRMDKGSGNLGILIVIEDISDEKRMKSTMSRYIDPGIADQLMSQGTDIMGGQETLATVLFSDVRSFTTITESLGAQGTVALLNEYFDIMVEAKCKNLASIPFEEETK